jgi:nitrate/nitrite-specific signal transduction histidine kinase
MVGYRLVPGSWIEISDDKGHGAMQEKSTPAAELIALLDEYQDEIASAWLDAIRQRMPDSVYVQRPAEEIYANNLLCLMWFKRILSGQSPQVWWWQEAGREITDYVQMGLGFSEVVQAGLLFTGVIHPFIRRVGARSPAASRQAFACIDECVHEFVNSLASWYMNLTNQHVQEQQQRTALMLEMVQMASSTLELDKVLGPIARGIAQAAGTEHCMLILVDDDEKTCSLWVATEEFPDSVMASLEHAPDDPFPLENLSVARLAFEEKRPLFCSDALADPRMNPDTAQRLGIKSILAVPCVVKGRVVAVADVLVFDEPRAFSEEQVELAWGVANAVAPAIENARLHQQIEHLAMAEERARLAREIHDELAQTLGMLQLQVSFASDLLAENRQAEAQACLLDLQDAISEAHTSVREEIFNLRTVVSKSAGFLPSLRQYLSDYRSQFGIDVRLEAAENTNVSWTNAKGEQILRIVQEALSNARKHSGACRVTVRITGDNSWTHICVEDDGRGFSADDISEPVVGHVGLHVMRERAQQVGGELTIESQPGQGTRVVLQVPTSENKR